MRKSILFTLLISFILSQSFAQSLPEFLQGTWKAENSETYEHWDKINDNCFKGFSYKLKDGKMVITEYLNIIKLDSEVVYTATVLNQNKGIGIDFKLTGSDSLFTFENPDHDFPKFIRYQYISENKMKAIVGTDENNFTLNFKKLK